MDQILDHLEAAGCIDELGASHKVVPFANFLRPLHTLLQLRETDEGASESSPGEPITAMGRVTALLCPAVEPSLVLVSEFSRAAGNGCVRLYDLYGRHQGRLPVPVGSKGLVDWDFPAQVCSRQTDTGGSLNNEALCLPGGVIRGKISVSQILYEIFVRTLFGVFKDLHGCTLGCASAHVHHAKGFGL